MLRVNADTGNIYGFLDEGGKVDFQEIPQSYGELILTVKGKQTIQKRLLQLGSSFASFVFSSEDVNAIGVGSHPYTLVLIDEDGNKNTLYPDASISLRPTFNVEE